MIDPATAEERSAAWQFLGRAGLWIVAAMVLGAAVGFAVSFTRQPAYRAVAYIQPPMAKSAPAVDVEAYAVRANSMGFAARMQRESGLPYAADEWRRAVRVATDGPDVVVFVEHPDQRAARAMLIYAQKVIVDDLNRLYGESHNLARELVRKIREQIDEAERAAAKDPRPGVAAEIRRGSLALLYRVLYDLEVTIVPSSPAQATLMNEPKQAERRALGFSIGGAMVAGGIALVISIMLGYSRVERYRSRS